MDGYYRRCVGCLRYRNCRKCAEDWYCEECHPVYCTRHGRKARIGDGRCCQDCRHCLVVIDQFRGHTRRGCCTLLGLMVAHLGSAAGCSTFEPKVPQVPYVPGSLPRLLEVEIVEEIRFAMVHVEELLKALELQPTRT